MTNYSRVEYPGLTGSAGSFVIPFPYLDPGDIEVFVDAEAVPNDDFSVSGSELIFRPGFYPSGRLTIRRRTSLDDPEARFSNTSRIRPNDLNRSMDQAFFAVQEVVDGFSGMGITFSPGGDFLIPKSAVGLSEVDNTSDIDKPVSKATQDALDLKLDASAFTTDNLFQIVVDQSGGTTGINARTLQGETPASLKDWRQATNKPSAFPPSPHVHDASDITSGEFVAARIPEGGVTRHQTKLRINYGQLDGVPPGALGEVTDGKTYIRTQGKWIEFDPEENEILSGLGISLSDILGD